MQQHVIDWTTIKEFNYRMLPGVRQDHGLFFSALMNYLNLMLRTLCRARRAARTKRFCFISQASNFITILSKCMMSSTWTLFIDSPSFFSCVNPCWHPILRHEYCHDSTWLAVRSKCASLNVMTWSAVSENIMTNHSSLCVSVHILWSRPPTAFMTGCSNVKSWLNADACMDYRLRPCEHISLMSPSHIFIVRPSSRVGRQREFAISSERWEVTVFFNCKTSVVLQF